MIIMNGATLAFLFLLWPLTSARYGHKTHNTFRAELPQYSPSNPATIEVHRKWRAEHTQARANSVGCLAQVIYRFVDTFDLRQFACTLEGVADAAIS